MGFRIMKFACLGLVFSVLLSVFSTLSCSAISFTQDLTLKYATSGPPKYGISFTSSGSPLPAGYTNTVSIPKSDKLFSVGVVSNTGANFSVTSGNFISVEFTVGGPSCGLDWTYQFKYMNEGAYFLEMEEMASYSTNSGWCRKAYRAYFQAHTSFTGAVQFGWSGGIGSSDGLQFGVMSVQIWNYVDWNNIFGTEDIVKAIQSQNNGSADITASITNNMKGLGSQLKQENADQLQAIHHVSDVITNNMVGLGSQLKEENAKQLAESQKQTEIMSKTSDFVTDTSTPDASDIANADTLPSVGLLPAGPIDSLLLLPLNIMNSITSSLGGTCSPVIAPLPFSSGQNITFPCFGDTIYKGDFSILANLIGPVGAAFILYSYFKHLYKKVDRATSLETSDEDEWGIL